MRWAVALGLLIGLSIGCGSVDGVSRDGAAPNDDAARWGSQERARLVVDAQAVDQLGAGGAPGNGPGGSGGVPGTAPGGAGGAPSCRPWCGTSAESPGCVACPAPAADASSGRVCGCGVVTSQLCCCYGPGASDLPLCP